MSCRTKRPERAERQAVSEPYLFDEQDLPLRRAVVASAKQGRNSYTGQRLLDDERKTARLVELLMMGCGMKKIARALHSSKESVRAALEVGGKIRPYKERFIVACEEIIELGTEQYEAALENDAVPVASIPIGVGIFFDKRALLCRESTSIAARVSAVASTITADQWRTWVRSFSPVG